MLLASTCIPRTVLILIWTYLHYQHRPKPAIGTSDVIQLLCACFFKCCLSDGRYESFLNVRPTIISIRFKTRSTVFKKREQVRRLTSLELQLAWRLQVRNPCRDQPNDGRHSWISPDAALWNCLFLPPWKMKMSGFRYHDLRPFHLETEHRLLDPFFFSGPAWCQEND
jgi:hypothetical protein